MIQYTQEYIRQLLTRYMDGTTTLEEEDALRQYFLQPDVPEEWHDYRLLFEEIEAMRPQPKARRHWRRWSVAAAVAVLVVSTVTLTRYAGFTEPPTATAPVRTAPLVAQTDSAEMLRPEAPNEQPLPDTTASRKQRQHPRRQRRLRKPEPTMTDLDKGYALLAQMRQEYEEVERQMAQARQEIIHARLTAAGYVAVQEEDGTIIYIEEPKEYFAYEE